MSSKDKDNKRKVKHKKRGKTVLKVFLVLLLLCFSAAAGVGIAVIKSSPTIDVNFYDNLSQSARLFDKDNHEIGNISDVENRQIKSLKEIPVYLQKAFIAIEDERFESHHGIDVKRIFGALWYDLKTMSRAQGASTITQQLVKNTILTPEKKVTRKLQEAYLALKLERMLSKDQILEYYLNTIYLGGNAYGVQAASKQYFNKNVSDLDLAQSALIAGLTQNPAKYYPYSKKNKENPQAYLDRQHLVLKNMLSNGFITQEQYNQAYNEKLTFTQAETASSSKYQWFVEAAVDQIAEDFAAKYGITETEAKQKLRTSGYDIYLTIDTKIQEKTEEVINNSKYYPKIAESKKYYSTNSKDKKLIQPQSAAVIMDVTNGEVRAIVGGRGPHPLRSYNRATDPAVARQPGSSIKPLAVYAPALDTKIATAATVIEDSPMPQSFVSANGGWSPKNYDGRFRGNTTIRNAVKDSINLVAVKLEQTLGTRTGLDYVKNHFHISTVDTTNDKNLSALALGGMTHGVTPLEMAAAYSVFANDGIYSEPIMYTKIVDRNGKTVLEKETSHERAISSQAAYIMNDMLQTVVKSGTGTKARLGSMPSAGKTGTTDDHTNGWYVGITPYYAGAVWIGHDDRNYPIKGLVGGTEAPMWRDIMLTAHKGLEVKSFPKTNNIVTAEVCLDSGKAPSEYCSKDSRGSRVIREIFIEGTQPVEICDFHTAANTVPPTETPQNPNPVTPQPGTDENGNTNTDTPGNTTPNGDNGDTPDDNNSGEDNSNNGQTNNNNNNNTNNTQPKGQ